jgi:dienelactone hydrolase
MATTRATAGMARPRFSARVTDLLTCTGAAAKTAVCLLELFPMLPSRPLDWVTPRPVVERLRYRTSHGDAEGDLYRPPGAGPHPGVAVCLGVVPFGVDHPQVPRLGEALARSGFAALLYWSPAMRDFRLDPADVEDLASAYAALLARPDVDAARSGLLGTCVGGAFALMAAASPRIRDRVAFVAAYAAYASMWTLARDIASASTCRDGVRGPWTVDPLTRKVYVHSMTALLEPGEARRLRDAFADRDDEPDLIGLSEAGRAVLPLLAAPDPDEADDALRRLPVALRERLTALSPRAYLPDLRAPLVVLLHDRDDPVVPVGESRRLRDALADRGGVRYTEFTVFKHLDPTKGNPSPAALARELVRFGRAMFPLFRQAAATVDAQEPPGPGAVGEQFGAEAAPGSSSRTRWTSKTDCPSPGSLSSAG